MIPGLVYGVQHNMAALTSWLLTGGALRPVNLRPSFKQAKASREKKEIPPEGVSEEGIKKGVGAGVDGVEEDQQQFGIWHGDERELEGGWHSKDGDGSHADKVCEDEHGHAFGHASVGVGVHRRRVPDGQVDAEVTATHTEESQDVEEEERHHVDLSHRRLHIHGQADTHL